jgi:hypothetical protein
MGPKSEPGTPHVIELPGFRREDFDRVDYLTLA